MVVTVESTRENWRSIFNQPKVSTFISAIAQRVEQTIKHQTGSKNNKWPCKPCNNSLSEAKFGSVSSQFDALSRLVLYTILCVHLQKVS
jgi:hypothetical protein